MADRPGGGDSCHSPEALLAATVSGVEPSGGWSLAADASPNTGEKKWGVETSTPGAAWTVSLDTRVVRTNDDANVGRRNEHVWANGSAVTVAYLASYENMGVAEGFCGGACFCAPFSINATWDKPTSELALFEATPGGDASSIRAAAQKVQDLGGHGDASTADAADTQSRDRLRKAEADLARARTARDKSATKTAYANVAACHVERGDLAPAVKAFSRARDHCQAGSSDQVEACVMVAVTAAAHGAWSNVASYCAKAEHALDAPGVATTHEALATVALIVPLVASSTAQSSASSRTSKMPIGRALKCS